MWNKLVRSPFVYLYLLAGVVFATAAGFLISYKLALPLLQVAVSYPVMFTLIANRRRKRAFGTMLFWAVCMAVIVIWAVIHYPDRAVDSIFHGKAYVAEMFRWIRTGIGAESDPMQFVPQHLLHFALFCVLSLFTASIGSLLMGAVLMNYMSFYAGNVIAAAHFQPLAIVMAWHVWAIVRVASFVILGVILAEPGVCRLAKVDYDYEGARPYFWAALTGLGIDIALKGFLAPWWSITLRRLIS
jgi:hypothetical protein